MRQNRSSASHERPSALYRGLVPGFGIDNGAGKLTASLTWPRLPAFDLVTRSRRPKDSCMTAPNLGFKVCHWKVKTSTGRAVGLLVTQPRIGSTDRIDVIGAGASAARH